MPQVHTGGGKWMGLAVLATTRQLIDVVAEEVVEPEVGVLAVLAQWQASAYAIEVLPS